jgi:hypothetical protein
VTTYVYLWWVQFWRASEECQVTLVVRGGDKVIEAIRRRIRALNTSVMHSRHALEIQVQAF